MKFFRRMIPASVMAVVWGVAQFYGPDWLKLVSDPMTTTLILVGAAAWLDWKQVESKVMVAILAVFILAGTLLAFGMFLPGLGTFLLAQLGLVWLSISRIRSGSTPNTKVARGFVLPVAVVAFLVATWVLGETLPQATDSVLKGSLLAYAVVMVAMVTVAAAAASLAKQTRWMAGFVGASALFLSDTLLGVNMFGGVSFPGIGHVIMGLYWVGLAGYVLSGPPKKRL